MTQPRSPTLWPLAILLAAVTVWGLTFTIVDRALDDVPPLHFICYRFGLGSLVLWLILRRRLRLDRAAVRAALPLGIALLVGFVSQTRGLLDTTPARSAFITGLSVLLVPLVGWISGAERPRSAPVVGALLAACGLYALFRGEGGALVLGQGDLITFACSIAFAAHILLVPAALRSGTSVFDLTFLQCLMVALATAPTLLLDPPRSQQFTPASLSAILAMGALATPAFICQVHAQRHLTAAQTAVVLALEPGMAAVFSVALDVEPLTMGMLVGVSLLVTATVIAELRFGKPESDPPGQ